MANSTTHVDTIVSNQYGKEITANAYFDAASPATLYGRRASTCGGTTWGYYGGNALVNGVVTQIANGTIALPVSATSYIEANPTTGAVTANSTAFTSGYIPLYSVVVGSSAITSWTDYRIGTPDMTGMLTKSLSDANTSLSASEARNEILTFSGTLTATRNIVVPLVPKEWIVYNGTGQSLQVIGATGTGVTVASGRRAVIYSDGTNVVRVTPDTLGTAPLTITGNYTLIDSDKYLICNGSASITLTLPTASSWAGREITVKTRAAYTVISASSNVKPLDTDTAGTAILAATAGKWATLVSDGSNWVIMSGN